MPTPATTPTYTARLGVPVPDMETLAERYRYRELKLIDLLVAVLLERGGPVAPDRMATAERWAVN